MTARLRGRCGALWGILAAAPSPSGGTTMALDVTPSPRQRHCLAAADAGTLHIALRLDGSTGKVRIEGETRAVSEATFAHMVRAGWLLHGARDGQRVALVLTPAGRAVLASGAVER